MEHTITRACAPRLWGAMIQHHPTRAPRCPEFSQPVIFIPSIIATLLLVLSILFIAFMIWFAIEYPEEFRRALEENY